MNKTGLILFHGFFEHKERHRLNAEWFENLGINTHLVDLPGHGEGATEKGDLESWKMHRSNAYRTGVHGSSFLSINQNNRSLPKEFKVSSNYPNPFNPSTIIDVDIG